jgi:tetratricopeptide (TPR) repeat protein
MTFGAELRRLRRAAGLSLSDLSSRVHYSRGYLSKIENGVAKANAALASSCDNELTANGLLLSLVPKESQTVANGKSYLPGLAGLPPVTHHFIGRQKELARITATISRGVRSSAAISVVHGVAGVGKTTLVRQCLHSSHADFKDGVLFIDLRGYSSDVHEVSAADALSRLLRTLGVPDDEIPSDPDDRATLYQDRLHGRNMLIVLDNARTVRQILPLIPGESRCRVLITSRNRLSTLDDADHVELTALPQKESVRLLNSLRKRGETDFADTAVTGAEEEHPDAKSANALGEIIGLCDGLPLAIRIAAARLRSNPSWSLADLARKLADKSSGLDEFDDGERSIAAAFHLSYQYLSPHQRRMFGLLAIHPGSEWDLSSVAALSGLELSKTERLLADLYDANLIAYQGQGRYQFYDLLRTFAREIALSEIPESEQRQAIERLLEMNLYAVDLVDKVLEPHRYRRPLSFSSSPENLLNFADDSAGLAWLNQEWPTLVDLCAMAERHGFHNRCWELAFALRGFFFRRKLWDPWLTTHQVALRAAKTDDPWAYAVTTNNLGLVRLELGELKKATELYQKASELFSAIDDKHGAITAMNNLSWLAYYQADYQPALENMRKALDFYEREDSQRNAAITLCGIALVKTELSEFTDATSCVDRAFKKLKALGLPLDIAMAHNCYGWIRYKSREFDKAEQSYRNALETGKGYESCFEASRAEMGLGNVAAAQGNIPVAQHHWTLATELHTPAEPALVGEFHEQRMWSDKSDQPLPL